MDDTISERTIEMMDKAAINIKNGIAGEPIDLEEMRKIADPLPEED